MRVVLVLAFVVLAGCTSRPAPGPEGLAGNGLAGEYPFVEDPEWQTLPRLTAPYPFGTDYACCKTASPYGEPQGSLRVLNSTLHIAYEPHMTGNGAPAGYGSVVVRGLVQNIGNTQVTPASHPVYVDPDDGPEDPLGTGLAQGVGMPWLAPGDVAPFAAKLVQAQVGVDGLAPLHLIGIQGDPGFDPVPDHVRYTVEGFGDNGVAYVQFTVHNDAEQQTLVHLWAAVLDKDQHVLSQAGAQQLLLQKGQTAKACLSMGTWFFSMDCKPLDRRLYDQAPWREATASFVAGAFGDFCKTIPCKASDD